MIIVPNQDFSCLAQKSLILLMCLGTEFTLAVKGGE